MTDGTREAKGAGLRIVVSAGIAGLGAARALRQRGLSTSPPYGATSAHALLELP